MTFRLMNIANFKKINLTSMFGIGEKMKSMRSAHIEMNFEDERADFSPKVTSSRVPSYKTEKLEKHN